MYLFPSIKRIKRKQTRNHTQVMKKLFFCSTMALFTAISCFANDSKLHVKMNMKFLGDTIQAMMGQDRSNLQTFTGKQGVFEFDVEIKEPQTIYLLEPGVLRGDRKAHFYQVPAMPGEQMELTATDGRRYDISGSRFYTQYHAADLMMEEAQKEGNMLMERCQMLMEQGVSQDSVMKIYQNEMPAIRQRVTDKMMAYIKAHADEEAMAAVIPQLQDLDQMKAAIQLLSPAVRESRAKVFYENTIAQMEAQAKAEEESARKQASGVTAPDFTLNDLNGKPLTLSSLHGKYVILDFWGSWCGWCIKGFPEMKEYYKKYPGKFEILGIDCNDTEQKWKDAVKKHELPWLHVYNPRSSNLTADYGITGFPTKIIVGPDGKIVKTIVGEDPAFYTLLDELFGK